jgi:dTDP-4-dehydrorhamnose 3,5-epimerase
VKITRASLPEVAVLEIEPRHDERGFFARTFCVDELGAAGLRFQVVQENVSFNHKRGTLRGLHLQRAPHEEPKIVRCTRGAIFDVAVDVRPGSATAGRWVAAELSEANHTSLYVPPGFAHGFLTLSDDVEVHYLMGARFEASAATGYRFDDPAFGITWPFTPAVVSERDLAFGAFRR